ncbi:hypothetical protein ABG067_003169 [Albugo candida]
MSKRDGKVGLSSASLYNRAIPSQMALESLPVVALSCHPLSIVDMRRQMNELHPYFHNAFAFRSHTFTPKRIISSEDLKLRKTKVPHTHESRNVEDKVLGSSKVDISLTSHSNGDTIEQQGSTDSIHGDLQLDQADLAFFDDIFELDSILGQPQCNSESSLCLDESVESNASMLSTDKIEASERLEASIASELVQQSTKPFVLLEKWVRTDRQIGAYSPEARIKRIQRFREKRKHRVYHKTVKYDCRKRLANACPRIRGRFVKREKCVTASDCPNA